MAEEQQDNQVSYLLSDFNTRLRDIEEKSRIVKQRVSLIGNNLLDSKDELEQEIQELKTKQNEITKSLENLKTLINNILDEHDNIVRKDEIIPIERMLKNFQPLEFARIKDVEKLINQKIKEYKNQENI